MTVTTRDENSICSDPTPQYGTAADSERLGIVSMGNDETGIFSWLPDFAPPADVEYPSVYIFVEIMAAVVAIWALIMLVSWIFSRLFSARQRRRRKIRRVIKASKRLRMRRPGL